MITKDELAQFILQVADGAYSQDDWQKIAVNHYTDEEMEDARIEMVRYVLGYGDKQLSLKKRLLKIEAN